MHIWNTLLCIFTCYHCRCGLSVLIFVFFIFITTTWGDMHYTALLYMHAILFICSGYHGSRGIICPVSQRQWLCGFGADHQTAKPIVREQTGQFVTFGETNTCKPKTLARTIALARNILHIMSKRFEVSVELALSFSSCICSANDYVVHIAVRICNRVKPKMRPMYSFPMSWK